MVDISGSDGGRNPRMTPAADPDRRGGRRLDLLGSVNLLVPKGPLEGHRFALEAGLPVFQDLRGPQLGEDWSITVGWQYAFHARR
jgi:hypothetical protein